MVYLLKPRRMRSHQPSREGHVLHEVHDNPVSAFDAWISVMRLLTLSCKDEKDQKELKT